MILEEKDPGKNHQWIWNPKEIFDEKKHAWMASKCPPAKGLLTVREKF